MTIDGQGMTIAVLNRSRMNSFGYFLRKLNFDEWPQLINEFISNMSLVDPQPDVPGFAGKLIGDDRIILSVSRGIPGPAFLK